MATMKELYDGIAVAELVEKQADEISTLRARLDEVERERDRYREALERVLTAHDLANSSAFHSEQVCNGDGAPNAYNHAHSKHGLWDSDNIGCAGKACSWCHAIDNARKALRGEED